MEKRIPVHNPTGMPIYVGSNMVPPGETIDFPESQVPPHLRPAASAAASPVAVAAATDPIAELLKQPIKDILPQLANLTGDQLNALEAAEKDAEKPRSTLLGKITEERIARAMAEEELQRQMDAWVASLREMSEEQLLAEVEAFKDDEGRIALIQEEIDRRAQANAGGNA